MKRSKPRSRVSALQELAPEMGGRGGHGQAPVMKGTNLVRIRMSEKRLR